MAICFLAMFYAAVSLESGSRFPWIVGRGGFSGFRSNISWISVFSLNLIISSGYLSPLSLLNLGDDRLHGEIQPFVEGYRSISILIHGGEHVFPVVVTKSRQTETELFRSLDEDIDEGDKFALVNLAVPVSICSLERFPVEEIERLVLIRAGCATTLAKSNKGILAKLFRCCRKT